MKRKLLIVEDDPGLQSQLKWCFTGVEVTIAEDLDSAITAVRRHEPQVVTLDLGLPPDPGGTSVGFSILKEIHNLAPRTKVIVITGQEDKAHAVKAVGMGAYDFYQKPIEAEILNIVVDRAFALFELEDDNRKLHEKQSSAIPGLIASSEAMLATCRTIEKIAPTELTTLILGDTGTGKEVLARGIHNLSDRAQQGFHAINCAAIPENLLESELFGYEKGAFTGASKQKRGKIELANGGTLFLDEIGDMPLALQAKMLRFLQERVIERVGGHESIAVDVRVVSATHRDLKAMIQEQSFREDLYYRISEIDIKVPPLRDREGDTILIAQALAERFSAEMNRKVPSFSEDAIAAIESYRWPGNVREMENKIKRAVILADADKITPKDLEIAFNEDDAQQIPLNLREVRERAEKQAVLRALSISNNNVAQTARILGITRPTLYNLLGKFDIKA